MTSFHLLLKLEIREIHLNQGHESAVCKKNLASLYDAFSAGQYIYRSRIELDKPLVGYDGNRN